LLWSGILPEIEVFKILTIGKGLREKQKTFFNSIRVCMTKFSSGLDLTVKSQEKTIDDEQHRCKRLIFIQRMNIATDVAYVVEYLNLHC
jgi:hypothetical protein